jgi:hypothetical protein
MLRRRRRHSAGEGGAVAEEKDAAPSALESAGVVTQDRPASGAVWLRGGVEGVDHDGRIAPSPG